MLLPTPDRHETADVIVIGTGLSGTIAALEAASRGARVIVIDKATPGQAGGNSRHAGGAFCVPNDSSAEARAAFLEDNLRVCGGRGNRELLALVAANVNGDVEWLRTQGVDILAARPWPPHRVSLAIAAPGLFEGAATMLETLWSSLAGLGVTVAFETKARQLVMDQNAAVCGVRAAGPGGLVDLLAPAVVVAAGGYAANGQMLEAYVGATAAGLTVRGVPWATGDGLNLAQQAGAGLRGIGGTASLHIVATHPTNPASGQPATAIAFGIGVNRDGRRFVDESRGYVAFGKAVLDQPGQTAALIIGSGVLELPGPAGARALFDRLGIETVVASGAGELARRLDVPPGPLAATIEQFNAAITDGGTAPAADPPKLQMAYPIEPPYLAFAPLRPAVTLTFGGIMIDTQARALEPDGRPIPGLFAAGEGAGHLFFEDYIGGGSLTNCLVMGRIAGRNAAGCGRRG